MDEATVFIVDDDAAVRDSLGLLLGLKGFDTRSFASAEDFLDTCRPDWRGCILLDLRLGGMDGLELQRNLSARGIGLPVIFITAHGDVAAARAALKGGAADFLEKPLDDRALTAAIADALKQEARQQKASALAEVCMTRMARLTERERQVLEQVLDGHPNRDIARQLDISPRTVEVYKARLMEKMQARTLPDLIRNVLHARKTSG